MDCICGGLDSSELCEIWCPASLWLHPAQSQTYHPTKEYWRQLSKDGRTNCAICPPGKGENAAGKRVPRSDKHKRNWRKYLRSQPE